MKRRNVGTTSKRSTLASKRALIRFLIEQTGWGTEAISRDSGTTGLLVPLPDDSEEDGRARPDAMPSNIIPFPKLAE